MSKYLSPNYHISIDTAKLMAKVQCNKFETVKTNLHQEYEPNLICYSCKLKECNQSHFLYCTALIGSN